MKKLDDDHRRLLHRRGLEAEHLQAIEPNPLTAEERALFAKFEREGWSAEQQRAYVLETFLKRVAVDAAE